MTMTVNYYCYECDHIFTDLEPGICECPYCGTSDFVVEDEGIGTETEVNFLEAITDRNADIIYEADCLMSSETDIQDYLHERYGEGK